MRIIALAVLLTIVQASPPVPRKATDNASSSSKNAKQESGNQQTPSGPATATPKTDKDSGEHPSDTYSQETVVIRESAPVPKPDKDRWDKAPVVFAGILVLIGAIGVCAAYKTLKAIERQALSMRRQTTHLRRSVIFARRSANAAKASADALINAERPWISASVQKNVKAIRRVEHGQPISVTDDISFFTFVVKNHGRTPAEIFAIRAKTERTKKGIDGGLASDGEPDYGVDILRHIKLLAPNEEWEPDLDTVNLFVSGDPNLQEIRDARLHVIFWGVVLYRDQFRPDVAHDTRFCYTYFQGLDTYRPSGPSQYTQYK
jgi:hypothetical protein